MEPLEEEVFGGKVCDVIDRIREGGAWQPDEMRALIIKEGLPIAELDGEENNAFKGDPIYKLIRLQLGPGTDALRIYYAAKSAYRHYLSQLAEGRLQ